MESYNSRAGWCVSSFDFFHSIYAFEFHPYFCFKNWIVLIRYSLLLSSLGDWCLFLFVCCFVMCVCLCVFVCVRIQNTESKWWCPYMHACEVAHWGCSATEKRDLSPTVATHCQLLLSKGWGLRSYSQTMLEFLANQSHAGLVQVITAAVSCAVYQDMCISLYIFIDVCWAAWLDLKVDYFIIDFPLVWKQAFLCRASMINAWQFHLLDT